MMINGHGGQPQIPQIACREMRLRHGDFIAIPTTCSACPTAKNSFSARMNSGWRCTPGIAKRR
ncbi:hypothetical protein LN650_13970 [Klebsiella pneumoniae subsp. pneumoniae]|nr:hypothetical protein [Klebsiella pneumoniae subsp. pneumoniae]